MARYIMAIDQGTTSSRAMLFDEDVRVAAIAQEEFAQHYPGSGWVEHDPEDIWQTVMATARAALANIGAAPSDIVAIGITDYAQGELGDIVFIELPQIGTQFGKHDVFGTVEAVKAVSELYAPLSGEVVEVNDRLDKDPALVNTAPYTDGWMIKLRVRNASEKDELLGAAEYGTRLGE